MKQDLPRMGRDVFPKILAQLEGTGLVIINLTDTELTVCSAGSPSLAMYRVKRKPVLH